jgi:hypothetical protein
MENGVTDRLWDRDVQDFIAACRQEKLTDIMLSQIDVGNGRPRLSVSAAYRARNGRQLPVGYRWPKSRDGSSGELYVGKASASAGQELHGLSWLALRAGLWAERRDLALVLTALTDLQSKADGVRGRLQLEYLRALGTNASMTQAQELTLQTLNDLAYLYGIRSTPTA